MDKEIKIKPPSFQQKKEFIKNVGVGVDVNTNEIVIAELCKNGQPNQKVFIENTEGAIKAVAEHMMALSNLTGKEVTYKFDGIGSLTWIPSTNK